MYFNKLESFPSRLNFIEDLLKAINSLHEQKKINLFKEMEDVDKDLIDIELNRQPTPTKSKQNR